MITTKIFHNKKADTDISARKVIFYILSSFLLVAVFFLILWLNSSNKQKISEIPTGLENYLFVQRFLNSPSCFTSADEGTNRAYTWLINSQKFNQENFNKCYNAEDTKVKAYRLTLSYENQKITISTKNWDGFLKKAETKRVFVDDGTKIQTGELLVETQDAK